MNPSYRIVFYVSGHGFGHTSRTIEVIHAVLRARPEAHIVVKTSAPLRLFARTLRGTLRARRAAVRCGDGADRQPERRYRRKHPAGCRVSDARAGTRRGRSGVPARERRARGRRRHSSACLRSGRTRPASRRSRSAISHGIGFTKAIATRPRSSSRARSARLYRHATVALRLPMAGGFAGLEPITRDIPFIARHSSRTQDDVRRALGLPPRADGQAARADVVRRVRRRGPRHARRWPR